QPEALLLYHLTNSCGVTKIGLTTVSWNASATSEDTQRCNGSAMTWHGTGKIVQACVNNTNPNIIHL
ncbi:MAG: hypothetical protein ACYTXY_51740, partial [Nostoc sp.]